MSWQRVGTMSRPHIVRELDNQDLNAFEFVSDEGHVKVRYTIYRRKLGNGRFRCRVQFDELEVFDDEEIGSGDWRISTRVNGQNCSNSPEVRWSVGSGDSADLDAYRTLILKAGDEITVWCRVQEEDS